MLNLRAKEVKRFWRAAKQHLAVARRLAAFGDVRLIRSVEAYHAVYIGGYAVECGLKALYLSQLPTARHAELIRTKLTELGHNLEGLYYGIKTRFGIALPPQVQELFRKRITGRRPSDATRFWNVGMRYYPGQTGRREAVEFLDAVQTVMNWIGSR